MNKNKITLFLSNNNKKKRGRNNKRKMKNMHLKTKDLFQRLVEQSIDKIIKMILIINMSMMTKNKMTMKDSMTMKQKNYQMLLKNKLNKFFNKNRKE